MMRGLGAFSWMQASMERVKPCTQEVRRRARCRRPDLLFFDVSFASAFQTVQLTKRLSRLCTYCTVLFSSLPSR